MDPTTDLDLDLDPFDSVLSLEDEYYTEGHALGVADGSRAGRIEGRVFGLEKGFEKFVAMGALHGKAAVWAARLPPSAPPSPREPQDQVSEKAATTSTTTTTTTTALPPLLSGTGSGNPRLTKHVTTLHALSEPASLSTQNDEDAVADFDDRFKRAQAKVKIVEKLVGEGQDVGELSGADVDAAAEAEAAAAAAGSAAAGSSGTGATAKGPKRIGVKMVQKKEGKRGEERSMEDFGGPSMKGLRS